jgi:hypothetical protein
MPSIAQNGMAIDRDLLAIGIFCALGLVLSFAFIAYADAFEQIADLAGVYLGG